MKKLVPRLIGFYLNTLALFSPRLAGRKAFNIFCTPRGAPLKEQQKKFLDSAEKFRFRSGRITLQGYRWGSGKKKLLFLHGWQSHSYRWKNYLESFSLEEYTLYAFDAPAHGQSEGKYLHLPLYSRAIESFLNHVNPIHTVVSHSLGSFAILYSFYRLASLPIQRVIITGTPGEVDEFFQHYAQVLGLSKRTVKALYVAFYEKFGVLPSFFSASSFAKAVNVPVLNIHDEQDTEASYQHALDIHASMKNSTLITTSGLGHNLRSPSVVKHVFDFVTVPEHVKEEAFYN